MLALSACDKDFNLGSNILPGDDFLDIQITDTVSVNLYTAKAPHMLTTNPQYLLVGNYEDEDFGKSSASFFLQLSQFTYPDWGDTAIFDSVCLGLPLAQENYKYGGSNLPLHLQVYKASDTLKQKYYYSDQDPAEYTDFDIIGENDAVYFIARDTSSNDTINTDTTGLRIRLNDSFGEEMFDNAETYFFNYTSFFYNIFYGLYVKSTDENFGIYKIRNSVNQYTKNFGLIFYYHFPSSPNISRAFAVPFTSSNVKFNIFSHDFSTSAFPEIEDSTTQILRDKAYLQGMTGTIVKIKMPGLTNLDSIIINKAELVVKTESSSDYPPNDQLWLAGYDSTASLVYFDDFNYNTYQGATYINGEYHFLITRIVQEAINNIYEENNIELCLIDLHGNYNFQRCIINNGVGLNSSPTKLIITYTKIH